MDKTGALIVSVSAVVLGMILGALAFLRHDLGFTTFYFTLAFVFGVIVTLIMAVIFSVGFRLAQRSDNTEVAMAGMMRALMDYQQHSERQQAQTFRQLMAESQKQIAAPVNPWGDDDDDFTFPAMPTVTHTNGAGPNGHR